MNEILEYVKMLNKVIIEQSHNNLFYEGNLKEGGKELTKGVSLSINCDRCSIWLYNSDESSIICQQLYSKSDDEWIEGIELKKVDYENYFNSLKENPIIVADNAFTHSATSCFKDSYLIPFNISSMLDVPIIFKGNVIGVICIESLNKRNWLEVEIEFAQMISAIYSFAFSLRQIKKQNKRIEDMNLFIDKATLVTKADHMGNITYVNERFTEVSGWKLEEVIGKNHNIVNSGFHDKSFWKEMYNTVIKEKKIWNAVVTNKCKNGDIYWVDSFIKAEFDEENDKLLGFTSIRQDVTKIIQSLNEIDKKNTYLEHAAKILRHDMHSGINTYIPRGVSSLERRLSGDDIQKLKIESPLKLIKEGLKHAQKVYKGVYEFTNLVKKGTVLNKTNCNIKKILYDYLISTSYISQVILDDNLPDIDVNESLFCTAVDNLIRNGLKYNDSETKFVKVYLEGNTICVQDNGRGIDNDEFIKLSKPYVRKEGQKESGSGLGLNICSAILTEHGFSITAEKLEPNGTKLKIKIKND
jgi:PAS domain S-box-containing protein